MPWTQIVRDLDGESNRISHCKQGSWKKLALAVERGTFDLPREMPKKVNVNDFSHESERQLYVLQSARKAKAGSASGGLIKVSR